MTRAILTDELAAYFELRDKVAILLKAAGVKKRARHYVAEVLIDAGVIDFAELDEAVVPADEAARRQVADADDLEEMLGQTVPGFGLVIAWRHVSDVGPELFIRSADFDVRDRWVSLAEVQGH